MTAKLVISGIWVQYIGKSNDIPRICSVSAILRWKPIEELRELVNEPLPKILQATKEFGASIKQLSRLTGIGEKIIRNAKGRRNGA